jgi:hypothetical protein
MKRCPKCNRSFPDDNQKFCTVDGGLLVAAQPPFDPNATIQSTAASLGTWSEPLENRPTSRELPDLNETIAASAPTVVFPKQTGPTGLPTSAELPPAPLPPTQGAPVPQSQGTPLPQPVGEPLSSAAVAPPKKKSNLPLILGALLLLLLLGVGAVVAALFLVIKPRLNALKADRPIVTSSNKEENLNNNVNANSEETKTQPEFVAPPDTVKFTNSPANLEGKLAEHYLDFSFYYPNTWVVDPKAGTAGSGNFAKVERRLPPDFTQENFAVRWYESKGTYAADLPTYHKQVEEFSASLAKAFPEYRKVSEGPTRINSLDAFEFRWVGLSMGTAKGDLQLWGRVVFVPTGVEGDKTGAILTMFTTSLAPELSGVEDVGEKGQVPVILESFRFGKNR